MKVEQITANGLKVIDDDTRLSQSERHSLLIKFLGSSASIFELRGKKVIKFRDTILLSKQITYLGNPWGIHKKRIQIPHEWLDLYGKGKRLGFDVKFIGIYAYRDNVVFADFDPSLYLARKAHNSSAHVNTNDLYQTTIYGSFSRIDKNNNSINFLTSKNFAAYISSAVAVNNNEPISVFKSFNRQFLQYDYVNALDAVQEMYADNWKDTFQVEWPGFYLEYRVNKHIGENDYKNIVSFESDKNQGSLDFDLLFNQGSSNEFLGDLKASDWQKNDAPGNDQLSFDNALKKYGKFWYVIYEHQTKKSAKDDNDFSGVEEWNKWKRDVGYFERAKKPYNGHSYWQRFKDSVAFVQSKILEVNEVNKDIVFKNFAQGHQPDGSPRKLKYMIKKDQIDNFLILSEEVGGK